MPEKKSQRNLKNKIKVLKKIALQNKNRIIINSNTHFGISLFMVF